MNKVNLSEPTSFQIRMAELGKKDRCCNCHHPVLECPYYGDNDTRFTTQEKTRICNELSGALR